MFCILTNIEYLINFFSNFSKSIITIEWEIGNMTAPVEILELFSALESNNPQEVKDVKHRFHEQFNISK